MVQIESSDIVFYQNDDMVCWQLPDGIHIHIPKPVHLFERCDIPVFEHLYKLHEKSFESAQRGSDHRKCL